MKSPQRELTVAGVLAGLAALIRRPARSSRISITIDRGPVAPETPSEAAGPCRVDATSQWEVIENAWVAAQSKSTEQKALDYQWIGGALAIYAGITGEDPATLRGRLTEKTATQIAPPVPATRTAGDGSTYTATPVNPGAPVTFKEGRSTPRPERSPGAQRPVEVVDGDVSTP